MYVKIDNSRRNHTPLMPPVNYAGVAFSKELPKKRESIEDTKIHKANDAPKADVSAPFKLKNEEKEDAPIEELTEFVESDPTDTFENADNAPPKEEEKTEKVEKDEPKGILSDIFKGQFSFEDILLFASLFLLASGQIDDEILILAGVLLLLSHS